MIEKEELERLIAVNAKPLYRYCYYRLCGDEQLTEQTVSDVWLVLVKKQGTLRGGKDMRAFLYRTADLCMKHNLEKQKKQNSVRAPIEEWYSSEERSVGKEDEYFKDNADYDGLIHEVERGLEGELLEIFTMRFVEKKKLSEIVEKTGIPYSNVRYRIELIKRHVREFLENREK